MIHLLERRWKLIVGVTFACIVLAALITRMLPHSYQSEMKFLVNNERADLVITPGKDQSAIAPSEVSETQLNSEIELLKSHDILEKIVIDRKLYLAYQKDAAAPPSRQAVERASLKLAKALTVTSLRKTDIIDVTYRAGDPDTAVSILQDIGSQYLASHLAAHSAPGTDKFFSDQVDRFGKELADARSSLASYHQQQQLFSLPEQQTALVGRLESVSSQLADISTQIEAEQTRLQESSHQLSAVPERIPTQVKEGTNQAALQQLEPLLAQLENHRIELATKFKPTDRLVQEADRQVASTRQQIAAIRADKTTEQTTDVNPLHQSLQADATKSQIALRGLESQRLGLQRTRQDLIHQLDQLDQASLELNTREERVKEAEDNYLLYTHRLEEARLAEALDRNKLSNVVMIETPVASPLAVSPNMPLNLAFGFIFGICLSILLSALKEEPDTEIPFEPPSLRGFSSSEPIPQPTSGD